MHNTTQVPDGTAALTEIERDRSSLVRYARRFTHSMDDAEDAVQAASMIAIRRPDVTGSYVRPWLYTVLRNEAIKTCRRGSRTSGVSAAAHVPLDALAEVLALPDVDGLLDTRAALRACKPDERLALIGRAAGWSYHEIAARTGWTYTKVNRSVTEGRAHVRAQVA